MPRIILNDTNYSYTEAEKYFRRAATWAKKNCASFQKWDIADVSDVSLTNDLLAEYIFGDEKDSLMFSLKWE